MKKVFMSAICVLSLLSAPLWAQQGSVMPVLFLNGTGAHVVIPASATDNLINATIEGWVRWESLNKWSRVFDFGKEGNAAVLQNERENATLFFSIWDRTGKLHRAEAVKAIKTNTWQHMAITCGKTGMKLYVDGKLAGEDPLKLPFNAVSGGTNYIGKSNWPDDGPFHGYLADFRIWSTSRSQAEIRQTMFTQLKGNEPGLTGYWRFETMEGTTSPDIATPGRNASLIAGATVMNAPGPPISLQSLTPPGIPPVDLHKLLVRAALRDFRIDENEHHLIESARQTSNLAQDEANSAEKEIRKLLGVGPQTPSEEAFYKALESAHGDGLLSPLESDILASMVKSLGLSQARSIALERSLPIQAKVQEIEEESGVVPARTESYKVLVRTALMDRKIDANEAQMLEQVALADQIPADKLQGFLAEIQKELGIGPQNDIEATYFSVLKTAFLDGNLSNSEAAMLQSMKTSLAIDDQRAEILLQDVQAGTSPALTPAANPVPASVESTPEPSEK